MGGVFPKRVFKGYKFSTDSFFKLFHEGHALFTCSTQVGLLYALLAKRGTSCMIKWFETIKGVMLGGSGGYPLVQLLASLINQLDKFSFK